MDDIVRQAIAKWPNVPHCYGWLALDARGNWRMRDERVQTLALPGDRIANPALLGFINRNYTHDEHGQWYFQNGPQRVYINLEATPYIARTDPLQGFMLHTDERLATLEQVWLTEAGQLVLQGEGKVALVDDRDMAQCLRRFRSAGIPATDDNLLMWLEQPDNHPALTFDYAGRSMEVRPLRQNALALHFGFVPQPQARQN